MGILYWLAIFTTFCTCSTFSGATAADATSSSFSPQNGEYASRYNATSSSLVKTHSLPTASSNCFIASAKSLALTPGGTFIPCSYLNRTLQEDRECSTRGRRAQSPTKSKARLHHPRSLPGGRRFSSSTTAPETETALQGNGSRCLPSSLASPAHDRSILMRVAPCLRGSQARARCDRRIGKNARRETRRASADPRPISPGRRGGHAPSSPRWPPGLASSARTDR